MSIERAVEAQRLLNAWENARMDKHTCWKNDGGSPSRSCDACDEERETARVQKEAMLSLDIRHAMSTHDTAAPATPQELRLLAAEMEESLVDNECNFSHPDWRYVDGMRALAARLDPDTTTTHRFVETKETVRETLAMLETVVQFAYEHGFHEHGFPLVTTVRQYIEQMEAPRE